MSDHETPINQHNKLSVAGVATKLLLQAALSSKNEPAEMNATGCKYTEPEELPFNFYLNHKMLIKEQNRVPLCTRFKLRNFPIAAGFNENAFAGWDAIQWKHARPEELQFQFFEDQELRQDEEARKRQPDLQNKPPTGEVSKLKVLGTTGNFEQNVPAGWEATQWNNTQDLGMLPTLPI